jgi:hypothetical protein
MHTAYLIDPAECAIKQVTYNGDYKQISEHLGCDYFDCVRLANDDSIFVDDEGLLKDGQHYFAHADYPSPLAGRGLVLGTNAEGESISPQVSLEELSKQIRWVIPLF